MVPDSEYVLTWDTSLLKYFVDGNGINLGYEKVSENVTIFLVGSGEDESGLSILLLEHCGRSTTSRAVEIGPCNFIAAHTCRRIVLWSSMHMFDLASVSWRFYGQVMKVQYCPRCILTARWLCCSSRLLHTFHACLAMTLVENVHEIVD